MLLRVCGLVTDCKHPFETPGGRRKGVGKFMRLDELHDDSKRYIENGVMVVKVLLKDVNRVAPYLKPYVDKAVDTQLA